MSRQSKAAKKKVARQQITALHKRGERGPKATTPKHGKDRSKRWFTGKLPVKAKQSSN